jgi:threonine synthase
MSYTAELICGRCDRTYPLKEGHISCQLCGGALLISYDLREISDKITRNTFRNRSRDVWRYKELLPPIDEKKKVSLGEGGTALLICERLAQTLGIRKLFIKDETTNPTGSFLDRGMTVDVSRAYELGFLSLRCLATSGNFAASASAYASRAGLKCAIHLPKEMVDKLNLGKLYQIVAYGGDVAIEDKSIDNHEQSFLSKDKRLYTLSSSNPYFAEGEKTTAYEICEQLGWRTPDRIIVPMGHGEHISMIWKGVNELRELGLIEDRGMAMTGVQVGEYTDIVDRLYGGRVDEISMNTIKTIAIDLAMKKPSHGYLAIRSIKESNGEGVTVENAEVIDALKLLARTEGIFAEPAAASTIAGLKKLIDLNHINKSEEIVCVITGAGLKDPLTTLRFIKKSKAIDKIISRMESRKFTTRIGNTKLEILRFISVGETYGYNVWKKLKQRLGLDLDVSSIYQHLSELEKAGLITRTRVESVLGKPERSYYSLTDRGVSLVKSVRK